MTTTDIYLVRENDLLLLKEALEDFQKELKQLEIMNEWFYSDARDRLDEVLRVLAGILELEDEDDEHDEDDEWVGEVERLFAELCIDREGTLDYFRENED